MPKVDDRKMIHLSASAVIERPMVLIPLEEYEDLLEDAEIAQSKTLTHEIKKARNNFKKGKGRLLEDIISELEKSKA